MASMAYSTWKRRPSGEKVLTPLSYSERVKYILLAEVYFHVCCCCVYLVVWGVGCGKRMVALVEF